MTTTSSSPSGDSLASEPIYLLFALIGGALAAAYLTWAAAALALLLSGAGLPLASFPDAVPFTAHLLTSLDAGASWQRVTDLRPPPAGLFWPLLVALHAAAVTATGWALRRWRRRRAPRTHTSASWADAAAEKQITVPEAADQRAGRIVAGRSMTSGRLLAGADCISATVFGTNGSGKTLGLVVPTALDWQGPCVISTAKGPDLRWIIKARQRLGPVWIIAPEGLHDMPTARWSPVTYATCEESAGRMARWQCEASGLLEDVRARSWALKARALVGPVLLAANLSGGGIAKFYRWCLDGQDVRRDVRAILLEHGFEQMADNYDSVWRLHPDGIGSILFTASVIVDAYDNPRVRHSASGSDFTAEDVLDQCGTVCIVAPPSQAEPLAPMFTSLIASIIYAAERRYEKDGPLNPRLLLNLDEAGNVFRYPGLPTLLTTARGMGIQLLTVWHDLGQLQTRYGQDQAGTILSQSKLRMLLPGCADMKTLEYFSRMLGQAQVDRPSFSIGNDGRQTSSSNLQKDELAPIHALQQLPAWNAILQYDNLAPMRIRMRSVLDDPALVALTPHISREQGAR
ncbi:type IV secretory system conjugative DNA transfer family protein [Nonomuraea sp. SYSU D8015]|uniref:type IV secretory system conjugative DNA transfer family protein n=1 Tax=Nonomuraea sp. SYSU D8015 TaxID=2593644 RepID=UPI001660875F|nr:type IV secretory system conjugative DNA transfer family protein [Nonomuraea sp. SYSU D8015]